MNPAFVNGVGVSAPGWNGAAGPGAASCAPAVDLLPPTIRRRASPLARMVAEVAAAAGAEAGAELGRAALVLGSAYGELSSALDMIRSFSEGEGIPSPTRFHNSVHNAPAAYISIATANRGMGTAIAAGRDTPAMALLEALAILHERGGEALLVLADEPVPPPFSRDGAYEAGAVALLLSARETASTRARVRDLRLGSADFLSLSPDVAAHPCAGGFALAAAVAGGRAGPLSLGASSEGWIVDLDPVSTP